MSQKRANNRIPNWKEKMEEMQQLRYLILNQGMSQSAAAAEIGRSPKTVCLWIKAADWRTEIQKAKGKRQNVRLLKMDKSLPPFIAWLRIHHKELHRQLEPIISKYQSS